MNIKKTWIGFCIGTLALAGCGVSADERHEYGTYSREELDRLYEVSDEEKEELEKLGISYSDIEKEAEEEADKLLSYMTLEDPERCLFLVDGGMTCGTGQTAEIYNEILDKTKAVYNVDTDPNSMDPKETREYMIKHEIRVKTDFALGVETLKYE